jgi:hypothetical protein
VDKLPALIKLLLASIGLIVVISLSSGPVSANLGCSHRYEGSSCTGGIDCHDCESFCSVYGGVAGSASCSDSHCWCCCKD